MRLIKLVLTLALAACVPVVFGAGAGPTSVRAILFTASGEKGPSDPKLAAYEPVLRSNLRFESFHYVGEGSASVAAGGTATIQLAGGNHVALERDKAGGPPQVHFGRTVVEVSPGGAPVVLIGGQAGKKGEVYGIIVMAR